MKTAINYLTIQRNTLLQNAAVAHAEGRTDDRDRGLTEAYELCRAIEALEGHTMEPSPDAPMTPLEEYYAAGKSNPERPWE